MILILFMHYVKNYHKRRIILRNDLVLHPAIDLKTSSPVNSVGQRLQMLTLTAIAELLSGYFGICQACMSQSTFCDQHSHRLLKRVINNGIPVEIPD